MYKIRLLLQYLCEKQQFPLTVLCKTMPYFVNNILLHPDYDWAHERLSMASVQIEAAIDVSFMIIQLCKHENETATRSRM